VSLKYNNNNIHFTKEMMLLIVNSKMSHNRGCFFCYFQVSIREKMKREEKGQKRRSTLSFDFQFYLELYN
jgi:hypothetical protein